MKRSRLRPDPEKVREFQRRAREHSRFGADREPLKRTPRKTRAKLSAAVIAEVAKRCRGRCVRCRTKRALQRHHVLPVRLWPEYEAEPRNMVLVCEGCHDEHERAHRRLRLVELPEECALWAYTRGGRESLYIERTYPGALGPLAGGSGR